MAYKTLEDLKVWQEAQVLLSKVTAKFDTKGRYWFKDQLLRATLSISNNIAEGYERHHEKEYIQFLNIAKGSSGEVKSMLYAAHNLGFCSKEEATELRIQAIDIAKMIQGLIKYIREKKSQS